MEPTWTLLLQHNNINTTDECIRKIHVTRRIKIGRSKTSDVCIPSTIVSRTQCELFVANDKLYIMSLGQINSTFVNTTQVEIGELLELHAGDQIFLGTVVGNNTYSYLVHKNQHEKIKEEVEEEPFKGERSQELINVLSDEEDSKKYVLQQATIFKGKLDLGDTSIASTSQSKPVKVSSPNYFFDNCSSNEENNDVKTMPCDSSIPGDLPIVKIENPSDFELDTGIVRPDTTQDVTSKFNIQEKYSEKCHSVVSSPSNVEPDGNTVEQHDVDPNVDDQTPCYEEQIEGPPVEKEHLGVEIKQEMASQEEQIEVPTVEKEYPCIEIKREMPCFEAQIEPIENEHITLKIRKDARTSTWITETHISLDEDHNSPLEGDKSSLSSDSCTSNSDEDCSDSKTIKPSAIPQRDENHNQENKSLETLPLTFITKNLECLKLLKNCSVLVEKLSEKKIQEMLYPKNNKKQNKNTSKSKQHGLKVNALKSRRIITDESSENEGDRVNTKLTQKASKSPYKIEPMESKLVRKNQLESRSEIPSPTQESHSSSETSKSHSQTKSSSSDGETDSDCENTSKHANKTKEKSRSITSRPRTRQLDKHQRKNKISRRSDDSDMSPESSPHRPKSKLRNGKTRPIETSISSEDSFIVYTSSEDTFIVSTSFETSSSDEDSDSSSDEKITKPHSKKIKKKHKSSSNRRRTKQRDRRRAKVRRKSSSSAQESGSSSDSSIKSIPHSKSDRNKKRIRRKKSTEESGSSSGKPIQSKTKKSVINSGPILVSSDDENSSDSEKTVKPPKHRKTKKRISNSSPILVSSDGKNSSDSEKTVKPPKHRKTKKRISNSSPILVSSDGKNSSDSEKTVKPPKHRKTKKRISNSSEIFVGSDDENSSDSEKTVKPPKHRKTKKRISNSSEILVGSDDENSSDSEKTVKPPKHVNKKFNKAGKHARQMSPIVLSYSSDSTIDSNKTLQPVKNIEDAKDESKNVNTTLSSSTVTTKNEEKNELCINESTETPLKENSISHSKKKIQIKPRTSNTIISSSFSDNEDKNVNAKEKTLKNNASTSELDENQRQVERRKYIRKQGYGSASESSIRGSKTQLKNSSTSPEIADIGVLKKTKKTCSSELDNKSKHKKTCSSEEKSKPSKTSDKSKQASSVVNSDKPDDINQAEGRQNQLIEKRKESLMFDLFDKPPETSNNKSSKTESKNTSKKDTLKRSSSSQSKAEKEKSSKKAKRDVDSKIATKEQGSSDKSKNKTSEKELKKSKSSCSDETINKKQKIERANPKSTIRNSTEDCLFAPDTPVIMTKKIKEKVMKTPKEKEANLKSVPEIISPKSLPTSVSKSKIVTTKTPVQYPFDKHKLDTSSTNVLLGEQAPENNLDPNFSTNISLNKPIASTSQLSRQPSVSPRPLSKLLEKDILNYNSKSSSYPTNTSQLSRQPSLTVRPSLKLPERDVFNHEPVSPTCSPNTSQISRQPIVTVRPSLKLPEKYVLNYDSKSSSYPTNTSQLSRQPSVTPRPPSKLRERDVLNHVPISPTCSPNTSQISRQPTSRPALIHQRSASVGCSTTEHVSSAPFSSRAGPSVSSIVETRRKLGGPLSARRSTFSTASCDIRRSAMKLTTSTFIKRPFARSAPNVTFNEEVEVNEYESCKSETIPYKLPEDRTKGNTKHPFPGLKDTVVGDEMDRLILSILYWDIAWLFNEDSLNHCPEMWKQGYILYTVLMYRQHMMEAITNKQPGETPKFSISAGPNLLEENMNLPPPASTLHFPTYESYHKEWFRLMVLELWATLYNIYRTQTPEERLKLKATIISCEDEEQLKRSVTLRLSIAMPSHNALFELPEQFVLIKIPAKLREGVAYSTQTNDVWFRCFGFLGNGKEGKVVRTMDNFGKITYSFDIDVLVRYHSRDSINMDIPAEITVLQGSRSSVLNMQGMFAMSYSPLKNIILSPTMRNMTAPSLNLDGIRYLHCMQKKLFDKLQPFLSVSEDQINVISKIVQNLFCDCPSLNIIEGTAGSGKTRVLVWIVMSLLADYMWIGKSHSRKIFIITTSNESLNYITYLLYYVQHKLKSLGKLNPFLMVLVGAAKSCNTHLTLQSIANDDPIKLLPFEDDNATVENMMENDKQMLYAEENAILQSLKSISPDHKYKRMQLKRELRLVEEKLMVLGEGEEDISQSLLIKARNNTRCREVLRQAQVIVTTVEGFANRHMVNAFGNRKNSQTPICLLDDAQRIPEVQSLLSLVGGASRLVLAGDLNLPVSKLKSKFAEMVGLQSSLLLRVSRALDHDIAQRKRHSSSGSSSFTSQPLQYLKKEQHGLTYYRLTEQMRMPHRLTSLAKDCLGATDMQILIKRVEKQANWSLRPYVVFDHVFPSSIRISDKSIAEEMWLNMEAQRAVRIVRYIERQMKESKALSELKSMIIAPDETYLRRLYKQMQQNPCTVPNCQSWASLLDSCVGTEAHIVMVCIGAGNSPFLDPKLLLLALTRSKLSFIVVGHLDLIKKQQPLPKKDDKKEKKAPWLMMLATAEKYKAILTINSETSSLEETEHLFAYEAPSPVNSPTMSPAVSPVASFLDLPAISSECTEPADSDMDIDSP